jgi:hypothetical protein
VWKLYNTAAMDFHLFFCARKAKELEVSAKVPLLARLGLLPSFACQGCHRIADLLARHLSLFMMRQEGGGQAAVHWEFPFCTAKDGDVANFTLPLHRL